MLPVTGYVDRWSVPQGGTIRFMVSSRGGAPFRARLARIFCGDPNPDGPGYRESPLPCPFEGEHPGWEQPVLTGSRAVIPVLDLAAAPRLAIGLTILATLPAEPGEQALFHWVGDAGTLLIVIRDARLVAEWKPARGEPVSCRLPSPVEPRRWLDIALIHDVQKGALEFAARPRPDPYLPPPQITSDRAPLRDTRRPGQGRLTLAARQAARVPIAHFNGRIERPSIWIDTAEVGEVLARQTAPLAAIPAQPHALWDFAIGIGSDRITDIGPHGFHGTLENLPTRAVTGSTWSGQNHRWTDAPGEYAAIHFHDDDVGDLGWAPTFEFRIPLEWPSGLYALHLETAEGRDNIPFVVRAAEAGTQARIALLLPTLTYQVYGQYPRGEMTASALPRAREWGALDNTATDHPEYGLSAYNTHRDGSGVSITSMRRPMLDKRINQIHRLDDTPGGSGTYWLAADTYLIDWMDRRGIDFEIITDHDLQEEGVDLLKRYAAVMTGQHPEYHTVETHGAVRRYIAEGGRFLYLGGNGFYWKIVPFQGETWAVELRRAEGGIRTWAAEPGEGYHAFDGSYGGLWRRLGQPPQGLVGVGFSSQGGYRAEPYRFTDAILDPRLNFMRQGLEDRALPGASFGEQGLMGGGAAGHEIDRADASLGTPGHALVLASGVPRDPSFEPTNEERLTQEWPGPREAIIRSDITFFETAGGGAVFSVGSMSFIGALPINAYDNTLARLLENVVRRFSSRELFSWPPWSIANDR
ncbi:N,N-dimethylformamidase [Roseomonas sp. JC162]|uniref:N,N-dimethylformamidase n=1 Tax=Neoroseomonas marina TaxID=1232220 RepID=A0A848EKR7_9PROT|nr:N,N-dimethylformamidase [Neoroseomonas marina]